MHSPPLATSNDFIARKALIAKLHQQQAMNDDSRFDDHSNDEVESDHEQTNYYFGQPQQGQFNLRARLPSSSSHSQPSRPYASAMDIRGAGEANNFVLQKRSQNRDSWHRHSLVRPLDPYDPMDHFDDDMLDGDEEDDHFGLISVVHAPSSKTAANAHHHHRQQQPRVQGRRQRTQASLDVDHAARQLNHRHSSYFPEVKLQSYSHHDHDHHRERSSASKPTVYTPTMASIPNDHHEPSGRFESSSSGCSTQSSSSSSVLALTLNGNGSGVNVLDSPGSSSIPFPVSSAHQMNSSSSLHGSSGSRRAKSSRSSLLRQDAAQNFRDFVEHYEQGLM